jgi:hypothetical protein
MRRIARAAATAAWMVAVAAGACSRPGAHPPPARTPEARPEAIVVRDPSVGEAQALREVFGYVAGPLTVGDDWGRRTYSRNGATVEVTLAWRELRPYEYEDWYQQSRHYPTARLPFPADQSSGFFTCAGDGGAPPCDLHGQTREGIHIEVHGNREASRAALEDLLASLAWK